MRIPSTLVLAVALAACGGSVGTENGDASPDGATDGTSDSPPAGGCTAAAPANGTACPRAGLVCEYGDDPRPQCNAKYTCTASGWSGSTPSPCPPPVPPGTGGCPPSADAAKAKSSPCDPEGLVCTYGDRFCVCSNCNGPCSTTRHFWCDSAPTSPQCPSKRPALGTACSPDGTICVYGVCADMTQTARKCSGGVWVDEPVACPA